MSYTKTTNFAIKDTYLTGNPAKVIKGVEIDAEFDNIVTADGLNLKRDGSAAATANIPMGGNKLTGLLDGSAAGDSVTFGQVRDSTPLTVGTIAGTADVITGVLTPALTAYTTGQTFRFIPAATNTGAVTININGLGAKAITKTGAVALSYGDLLIGGVVQITYDGTQFQLSSGVGGAGATGATGDKIFWENGQNVTASYSITAGKNAMTAGPVTINSGVTVTVPTGSTWSIV